MGAVLFARRLSAFDGLERKTVRVIVYKGTSRVESIREQIGTRGYAVGFQGLIGYINTLLPANGEIREALRRQVPIYPEIAIRELVANALIHQEFTIDGTGPMIEIFQDRIEITTPPDSSDRYSAIHRRATSVAKRFARCSHAPRRHL